MEKIQCPVCIHKPEAAHAWYGSTARVKRKHRTRETKAAHAWYGNAARVKRKHRTRDTDNGCRTGLWQLPRHRNLQTADTAKHPIGTWDKYELQSTWFHCTINLILLYNQLDFTAWSTCFFKEYALKASRFQHAFNLLYSRLLWWKEGIISSFTRIHHLSPQTSYIQCFMVKLHQRDSL